jgi:hypothetical protein
MIHTDKYPHRQYLVDEPGPELRRILHFIRHPNRPLRNPEFLNQKSIVLYLNRKGWIARVIHDRSRKSQFVLAQTLLYQAKPFCTGIMDFLPV